MRLQEALFGRHHGDDRELQAALATKRHAAADRQHATAEVRRAMREREGSLWANEDRMVNPFSNQERR